MKTLREKIEVMEAYERGERIEVKVRNGEWHETKRPFWEWYSRDYRVKSKTKFVPFETAEEFLEAQRVHGTVLTDNEMKYYSSVDSEGYVTFQDTYFEERPFKQTFEYACNYLKFEDGTPCGKEVEE